MDLPYLCASPLSLVFLPECWPLQVGEKEKAEKDRLAGIERERLADTEHREAITNEVVFMLTDYGMGVEDAKELTSKIASGAYPVVSINF